MRVILLILALSVFVTPVSALEVTAPEVPESGAELMPEETGSFAHGFLEILMEAMSVLRPDLKEAVSACTGLTAVVLLVSVLQCFSGSMKGATDLCGAVTISAMLFESTDSLIRLGTDTVTELAEYGKLLLPVMTSAMAAQGSVTSSAALYGLTAAFSTLVTTVISKLLIPMLYVFLALSAAKGALGEDALKKLRDTVKTVMSWSLKTLLSLFTGCIGLTGIVSGTTDAAALKLTKMSLSGMVPVVGGILSDASEAVLYSAGIVKNAAGVYGILALIAVFAGPFIRIGTHYLLLKGTGAICGIFGSKALSELIGDFGSAMGFVLGMTGAVCFLLMIGTVCFLRGVG